jgi:hypothetical protein
MRALRLLRLQRRFSTIVTLASLGLAPSLFAACTTQGGPGALAQRVPGQSDFISAPQLGGSGGSRFGAGGAQNAGAAAAPSAAPSAKTSTSTGARTVQETDLYAVEGSRLYYLNSYRGLMVFDITKPDAPTLLGRSPIFGDPQEMTVHNGVCVVVVGDWYGDDSSGRPFHGSIVRGLDATDPTNIRVVGEAQLGGYVQDTRVVGNVLYAVIEDYGWSYGWYGGWGGYYGYYGGGGVAVGPGGGGYYGGSSSPTVAVASVDFAGGVVTPVGYTTFPGTGGVFNVTPTSIMVATNVSADPSQTNNDPAGQTSLQYVDISDPGGAIRMRGAMTVSGAVTGWGPDNGRWNLDFADGATAHTLGCGGAYCGSVTDSYVLSTVDFTDPDHPALRSTFPIANLGWSAAALFSGTRLYLSPSNDYYASGASTPLSIYDLSSPTHPVLSGTTQLTGSVWMYRPDGTHLFSIGDTNGSSSDQVEVQYLNVSNAAAPQVIGTTSFGNGWAWTPAASTFKAINIDDTKGLMVVPFSGWDGTASKYTNGVQLISYTPSGMTSSATAFSTGWVQRGIFVNNRLFSISDEALAVVDYSNPAAPKTVSELTLARNVVNAQPQGATIAEVSSDWWGNDTTTSEMRVLPLANAGETTDDGTGVSTKIDGVGAQVFQNGTLAYVVTQVQTQVPCNAWNGYSSGPGGTCTGWVEQVQVVDTSNGGAQLRGQVTLPQTPNGWYGWGWGGFWYYDWFDGSEIVQVGNDALAFRRWYPTYAAESNGTWDYDDSLDALYVVDISNPDAPSIASMTVTSDTTAWWGDLQAFGNTLYTTHYDWVNRPDPSNQGSTLSYVRYYLDEVDLTDRAHPRIGQSINIPGQLVGVSSADPTILYTVDYRWDANNNPWNDLDVVQVVAGKAYLQSATPIDGWVGNVIVQNGVAYASAQEYDWMVSPNSGSTYTPPYVELHQIDLSNPQAPVDRVATSRSDGWGWLLAVQGDRAVVTSGWGPMGVDVYRLSPTAAPAFEQSVRTLGWGANSIIRQDNTLYLSSGYWGVQSIVLQ